MRRLFCALLSAILLGLLTAVAVAWAFAGPARQRHWVPGAVGLSAEGLPCWYLSVYEGAGFRWEVGWPVYDTEAFIRAPVFYEWGRPRIPRTPPIPRIRPQPAAAGGDSWPMAHPQRPQPGTCVHLVSVIDRSGWPWPALERRFRHDVSDELERIAKRDVNGWDRLRMHLSVQAQLREKAPWPTIPIWKGVALDSLVFAAAWLGLYAVGWFFLKLTPRVTTRGRIARASLMLVAGVVLTVTVSWGFALLGTVNPGPTMGSGFGPGGRWITKRSDSIGVSRLESHSRVAGGITFLSPNVRRAEELLPIWAGDLIDLDSNHSIVVYACGWPCPSLWHAHTPDLAAPSGGAPVRVPGLPLQPIWLGLAADTAIYSLAALLIVASARIPRAIARVLRRRSRRCPQCGYDLSGADHAHCPECGAQT